MARLSLVLVCMLGVSQAARILVFYPGPSTGVLTGFSPLLVELARRGHALTVVTARDLSAIRGANITQIVIEHPASGNNIEERSTLPIHQRIQTLWDLALSRCEKLLHHSKFIKLMKSSDKFDLFMGSPFSYMECSVAVAHHLKLPVVNIYSNGITSHLSHFLGHSFPTTYLADSSLSFSNSMNFLQRIANSIFSFSYSIGLKYYYIPQMDFIVHKHFPHVPSLQEMLGQIAVTLINSNTAVHPSQPLPTGVIPVGALTIPQKTELPKALRSWMDLADQGVIVVSLGSGFDTSVEEFAVMMEVFVSLPQRVLIRSASKQINGLPQNIKLMKWIPQVAVLAHPHCRLLVTRGGLSGWMEAVHYSVPVLGTLPRWPDQAHNLAEVETRGQGLYFTGPWTVTALREILGNLLHDSRYKENIQKASKIFWDQPLNPLQTAVFWTEYMIRHQGAPHLVSAAATMSWYQLIMLDVLVALVVALLLARLFCRLAMGWIKWCVLDYEYIVFNYMLRCFDEINRLYRKIK